MKIKIRKILYGLFFALLGLTFLGVLDSKADYVYETAYVRVSGVVPSGDNNLYCSGSVPGIPTNSTVINWVKGWYSTEGRCGEGGGLNYWHDRMYEDGDIRSQVQSEFQAEYDRICQDIVGTTNRQTCHNKLLCSSGYEYVSNTNQCRKEVSYSCTGSTPDNATMCSGDSSGLTSNVVKSLVGSCTTSKKCEYICNSGYYKSGNSCVRSCSPNCPSPSTICTGSSYPDGCGGYCPGTKNCKPGLWINANPLEIDLGESTTITWAVSNADSCTASVTSGGGDWTGSKSTIEYETGHSQIVAPTTSGTKVYTITCSNSSGSSSDSVTVTVNQNLPTIFLNAVPTTIDLDDSFRISWRAINANYCRAFSSSGGNWSGTKAFFGFNQENVQPSTYGTKDYILRCTNSSGSTSRLVRVVVLPPNPPTIDFFQAYPSSIYLGDNVRLSWNVSNADSCTASSTSGGNWSGNKPFSGYNVEYATPSSIGTKTYTLTCTNSGGSTSRSANVLVNECVCENSNNYCSGTLYNDSCGKLVCTGTKDPGCGNSASYCSTSGYNNGCYWCPGTYPCSGTQCTAPSYTCSVNNEWSNNSSLQTRICSGFPPSCNWSTIGTTGCFDTQDCGVATCKDSYTATVCHNGNVHEQTRGIRETCSPVPINPCGEELVDCGPVNPNPKEECKTGYVCKEINSDEAKCVPKSSAWSEN